MVCVTADDPFAAAPVGLARLSIDGKWQQVNRRICDMLGYHAGQLAQMQFEDVVHPDDMDTDKEKIARLLNRKNGEYSLVRRLLHRDGSTLVVHLSARLIQDERGRGDHYVVAIQNMSKLHQRLEELERHARHDRLTKIRNRAGFIECVRDAYRAFRRRGTEFALAFLDLDDFKAINDTLGHLTGDMLLKGIATRLSAAIGRDGVVARIGGDEFAILLHEITTPDQIHGVTYRVHSAFAPPFAANGQHVTASVSIGFAHCPNDARSVRGLLQHADKEMYARKNSTVQV